MTAPMTSREELLAKIPNDLPDDIQAHLFVLEEFIGDCDGKDTVISNGETCIDDGTIDASDAVVAFNGIVAALRAIPAPAQGPRTPLDLSPNELNTLATDAFREAAQQSLKPRAYWIEHPKFGMELSLDPPNEASVQRGWEATPLYALPSTGLPAPAPHAEVRESEWRPIDTKPKDHFPVLVWGPFGHRVAFEDVTWTWFEACAEEPMDWKPSHWMPLPTRPVSAPQQDRSGK